MELRKFPVTAPDGTEYRVEIEEWRESLIGACAQAHLYVPRKRWGFRRVWTLTLHAYHGDFNPADSLDYVAFAREAVADYYEAIAENERSKERKAEAAARKQAEVDRFNAWDGRVETEGDAE
jgi:hypothetical protein